MVRVALLIFALLAPVQALAEAYSDDFEAYATREDVSTNWFAPVNAALTLDATGGYGGSKAMKFDYNAESIYLSKTVSSWASPEIYVKFKLKVAPGAVGGIKFLKIFGLDDGTNYANWTWNYGDVNANQSMLPVLCYGDGSGISNDTNVCVRTTGAVSGDTNGAIITSAGSYIYVDDGEWHDVYTYNKYNTDGTIDGVMWVQIDGVEALKVDGTKNRNDANARVVDKVSFGDYANAYANITMWIDDVQISTTAIGTPPPAAGRRYRARLAE